MSHLKHYERIAVFGGVYSNHLALEATLADAQAQSVDAVFCLGDLGGFGPHPDLAADRLRESGVFVLQGNYDESVGLGLSDCQCGYTDPRDHHFADLSYRYTLAHTSQRNRDWMSELPKQHRIRLGSARVLMAHGSPRQSNEFLWESMTSDAFIERLLVEYDCDLLLVTHTGLSWQRWLTQQPPRGLVNVGAIGRPANDGDPAVRYAILSATPQGLELSLRRVTYDHEALAQEMAREGLPAEFCETIRSGWWTTCLEILPALERRRGLY